LPTCHQVLWSATNKEHCLHDRRDEPNSATLTGSLHPIITKLSPAAWQLSRVKRQWDFACKLTIPVPRSRIPYPRDNGISGHGKPAALKYFIDLLNYSIRLRHIR